MLHLPRTSALYSRDFHLSQGPDAMPTMDDENLANLTMQHYLDGKPVGLEAGVAWLKQRATKLFERGKYEEAKAMRELACEMNMEVKPELEAEASKHQRDYPVKMESE